MGKMGMNFVYGLVLTIIGVVILFNIFGQTATTLVEGGESITNANNCSDSDDTTGTAMTYNITNNKCYNSTGMETFTPDHYDLPLNTLFGGSGVVLMVVVAAILLFVVAIVMKKIKKQ